MTLTELFSDATLKPKAITVLLAQRLYERAISIDELLAFAAASKVTVKASCIEAIEYATRQDPTVANEPCWRYVCQQLTAAAPRVQWESAKVIGNIAHLFTGKLSEAITNLLANAEANGTVVRWAAAFALGEILKLKTRHNEALLPAVEALCKREQENGVKNKYLDALRQTQP